MANLDRSNEEKQDKYVFFGKKPRPRFKQAKINLILNCKKHSINFLINEKINWKSIKNNFPLNPFI
jgi:hypothetical protein